MHRHRRGTSRSGEFHVGQQGARMSSTTPPARAKTQAYEFEQMNLQVGGRIQFITHRSVKPIQHFSTMIGWVKDEYIIVRLPVENGSPVAVNEGDKLTIRVFSGINVCSFSCTVLRIFGRPLFYVHLSFPETILGTSLRTAMRVRVDIPAVLTSPAGVDAVLLVNLSVSGALVESSTRRLEDNSTGKLSFDLLAPPDNRQVRITPNVVLRNINPVRPAVAGESEVFTYGVQFIDLDPIHYTMLQNLTYEALITDRQKIV